MKIIIVGPLPNDKSNGGVAVFTECLAKEAARAENNVLVLTNKHSLGSYNFSNYKIVYKIVKKSIWNISSIIRFKPDLIISSLQYSLLFCFLNLRAVKVHILHGFTGFKYYSNVKFYIMHFIDVIIRKHFDYLLANSCFTKLINEEIFNIKSDGCFYIGLEREVLRKIISVSQKKLNKKNILFIGRIVPAKGVEKAIKAFLELKCNSNIFKIAGYGSELPLLKQKYKLNKDIKFEGIVNQEQALKLYGELKVFISLNPSEPFGITHVEAIASGMFVVAPKTGGQVEFLKMFPGRYCLVDQDNENSVMRGIKKGLKSNLLPLGNDDLQLLSFENTYLSIIKTLKSKDALC